MLIRRGKGHPQLGLSALIEKVDPHISRQRTVGLDLYGKLEPALILSKGQRTLLFIEGCRLCHIVVGPALIAGYFR